MRSSTFMAACLAGCMLAGAVLWSGMAAADGSGDPAVAKEENGKYFDKDGNPTFNVKDGTVDWYTYSGYVRYHSECHVCHGPNADGSSYAPALKDSLKTLSYSNFLGTVAGGKKDVNASQDLVMPAFGTNKNVMCVIDDIFVYLRARANDAVGRTRPANHEEKPEAAQKWQDSCFGQ